MCDCVFPEEKPKAPRCERKGSAHYWRYRSMIDRCYKSHDKSFESYGGRGIKVCLQWLMDFQQFVKDVGDIPYGLTMDRPENDKGYCPCNFRWANRTTQNLNRRSFKRGKSGLPKGIYKSQYHYFSQITHNKKVIFIGSSKNLDDVVEMHRKFYFELHGKNP